MSRHAAMQPRRVMPSPPLKASPLTQPIFIVNAHPGAGEPVGDGARIEGFTLHSGHAATDSTVGGQGVLAVRAKRLTIIGNEFLGNFYTPEDTRRARRDHLEGIVEVFPWIATVDAFQHWVSTHEGHSRAERAQAWTELMERFGGDVDWSGQEEARGFLWHRQLHIFTNPFYYIEYGIAQLGALQVWANFRADKGRALLDYKNALALGGSRSLPELFGAAGCRFDFSKKTIGPLVEMVEGELGKTGGMGKG